MDRLAAGGMTFTDAHSPSAVCTSDRYATLTGRYYYCWRSTLKIGLINGYGTRSSSPAVAPSATFSATLATAFRLLIAHQA